MTSINKQKILNAKQAKEILKLIKDRWDVDFSSDYVFLKNEKQKVFITNRDLDRLDLEKLRINSTGLYIAEIKDGIRLSIEGSQLIGPEAKKNVLEVDDKQARDWLKGVEIEYKGDLKGFVIIKNKDNYIGCGKAVTDKILNFIPKTRRIHAKD
jgi:NOL1/NOP2/fmu family ribosome biogenesis protein